MSDTSATIPNASSAPQPASLLEDAAAAISQELVVAHEAQRRGDFEASYDAYQQLAEHFISHEQLPNAKLFYERCLQIAVEHTWQEGQAAAHTNLGTLRLKLPDALQCNVCNLAQCRATLKGCNICRDAGGANA